MELWQDFLEQIELILSHGLDYEAPVVAEEEETAAGSGCLTRFEDLVPIRERVERPLDLIEANIVHNSQSLENTSRIRFYFSAWQSEPSIFFTRLSQITASGFFGSTLRHSPLNEIHALEHI